MLSEGVFHCEDSFQLLRQMGDNEADVIITDPPYPEAVQANLCSGSLVGTKSVPKYELPFGPLSKQKLILWVADGLRIARRWVISFCAVEDFGRLQDAFNKKYVRGCIWAKKNAMGQLTGDRPATAYEGVACLHREDVKKRWNGRGSYGIWSCSGTRGKKDRHPNEKPIDLALKLVALFSDRGETVLDPFCGSGAIGEACIRLGRRYVGYDFDREWVDRASKRLQAKYEPVTDEYALSLCKMWGHVTE